MISFRQELLRSHGFSFIPPDGLHAIIFANLWLLLPTKSVVAYARKHNRSAIFEWQAKKNEWYLYAGEYLTSWEKKVKVVNLLAPTKKGSVSWSAKPKSTKRGDNSSETCSNIVPYKGGLPPIGNIVLKRSSPIVLEGSSPPSARSHSNRCSTASKPKPSAPRPSMNAPPSSKTHSNKRKTSPLAPSATTEKRVYFL